MLDEFLDGGGLKWPVPAVLGGWAAAPGGVGVGAERTGREGCRSRVRAPALSLTPMRGCRVGRPLPRESAPAGLPAPSWRGTHAYRLVLHDVRGRCGPQGGRAHAAKGKGGGPARTVRADLAHHVRELGARAERLARRYRARAGERFAAIADRFPALDSLFAGQQQRVDDIAERLPRALGQRIAIARGDLAHASGAMRRSLLDRKLDRAKERLAAVRLSDKPIIAKIAEGHATLDRLWRIAEQLHPDKPLQRGYVRVEKRGGGVLTSAEEAKVAATLTLHFADGAVDARVETGAKASYAKGKTGEEISPRQQDLF